MLGAIATLKGIRKPSLWSFTQAQFDYSSGFMRRGFFGWLMKPLGIHLYSHFTAISAFLLLALLFSLVCLVINSEILQLSAPGELVAVYASSYSVSYLAHLNGYMDIPMALLCVMPLFLRNIWTRVAASVVCSGIGILIHEQFIFCFLPVLIVAALLGIAQRDRASARIAITGAAVLILIGLTIMGILARYGSLSESRARTLESTAQAEADRPLEHEVFMVASRTPVENLHIMQAVWKRPTFIPAQIESLMMFGPSAFVLSWGSLLLLRAWKPKDYLWTYALVLAATLSPLTLHLFGWDKNRWNELLCFNSFVLLLLIGQLFRKGPVRFPVRFRQICLAVILINMATGGGMLDNRHIRPWPFLRNPDSTASTAVPLMSQ